MNSVVFGHVYESPGLFLRKSDTGVYTCRARNEDGESTWTASLIVEGIMHTVNCLHD